jgi:hypothetical protein
MPGASFLNTKFENVTQELDGLTFEECTFEGCTLVYKGGPPPALKRCDFNNTGFRFEGAAANTIAFLQAMSAPTSGLQVVVRDTFPILNKG